MWLGIARRRRSGEAEFRARSGAAAGAAAAAVPATGQARDLPAHGRRADQLELFDYKPELARLDGKDLPAHRFSTASASPSSRGVPKMLGPQFPFSAGGAERRVDFGSAAASRRSTSTSCASSSRCAPTSSTTRPRSCCCTPASPRFGSPSLGSWVTYGLGTENQNLPGFIVLSPAGIRPMAASSCGVAASCPACIRACSAARRATRCSICRNPDGRQRATERRRMLDASATSTAQQSRELRRSGNADAHRAVRDGVPDAGRARTDAMDICAASPRARAERYGTKPGKASFANNCLLARRLVERGVRFVQLYHWGWDHHGAATRRSADLGFKRCREIDQPIAALLTDLKAARPARRHAGRLGRRVRPHADARESRRPGDAAHRARSSPGAFTIWMAGGGVKGGLVVRRDRRDGLRGRAKIPSRCAICTRPFSIYWASITTS